MNAADGSGPKPAPARVVFVFVVLAALAPCASAQKLPPLDAFGERAARAFAAVAGATIRSELPVEGLGVIPFPEHQRKAPFIAPGAKPGEVQPATCEKSQMLALIAGTAVLGSVNVGECVRDADLIRRGAEDAKAATEAAFQTLPAQLQAELRERVEWERTVVSPGLQGYAYTVLIMGHGFATASTAVVYDEHRKVAFAMQGSFDPLCSIHSPRFATYGRSSALCPRTSRTLLEAAKTLANGR